MTACSSVEPSCYKATSREHPSWPKVPSKGIKDWKSEHKLPGGLRQMCLRPREGVIDNTHHTMTSPKSRRDSTVLDITCWAKAGEKMKDGAPTGSKVLSIKPLKAAMFSVGGGRTTVSSWGTGAGSALAALKIPSSVPFGPWPWGLPWGTLPSNMSRFKTASEINEPPIGVKVSNPLVNVDRSTQIKKIGYHIVKLRHSQRKYA